MKLAHGDHQRGETSDINHTTKCANALARACTHVHTNAYICVRRIEADDACQGAPPPFLHETDIDAREAGGTAPGINWYTSVAHARKITYNTTLGLTLFFPGQCLYVNTQQQKKNSPRSRLLQANVRSPRKAWTATK